MSPYYALFAAIFLLSSLLAGLIAVLRRYLMDGDAGPQEYIRSSVFSFFGSLYAFFLGFAMVTLWSAFLTAKTDVGKEAEGLLMAYRVSHDFPNSDGFRSALMGYVRSVKEDEWPQMDRGAMSEKTRQHQDNIWKTFRQMKPSNNEGNDLYVNLGTFLKEAGIQRLNRALLIKGNLYPPLRIIIIFGFFSMLYCLYFSNIQQNWVQIIFDFIVIFILISIILFIHDIDTPFSGYVIVPPDAFDYVYQKMIILQQSP